MLGHRLRPIVSVIAFGSSLLFILGGLWPCIDTAFCGLFVVQIHARREKVRARSPTPPPPSRHTLPIFREYFAFVQETDFVQETLKRKEKDKKIHYDPSYEEGCCQGWITWLDPHHWTTEDNTKTHHIATAHGSTSITKRLSKKLILRRFLINGTDNKE